MMTFFFAIGAKRSLRSRCWLSRILRLLLQCMRGCDSVIKFVNAAEPHIDCIGISKYGQGRSLLKVISFGADTDQAY